MIGATREAAYNKADTCRIGYVMFANTCGEFYQNGAESKPHRMMTQEEVERWRNFLTEEVEKFEKRLKTYLKRYGLSKCTYSTY